MPQPTPYDRITNLQNDQALTPSAPYPAPVLDQEYNAIKITTDEILQNLALIQRDDGELANDSVGFDQLHDEVVIGFGAPEAWATDETYGVGDTVFHDNAFWYCQVAHTSTDFNTDNVAGYWLLIADFTAAAALGAIMYVSDTAPPLPVHGQQWFESDTGNTYVFYEDIDGPPGQWVHTNGAASLAVGADSEMPTLPSYAAVTTTLVDASVGVIRTSGYTTAGDGGDAIWARAVSEPTHAGKVQSGDGAWWALTPDQVLSPMQLGAVFDGATNDTQKHKDFAGVLSAFAGGQVRFPHNKISVIWPGTVPSLDVLYDLSGMRGLTFDFNGSALRATGTSWVDGSFGLMLNGDNENIRILNPHYQQPNFNTITTFTSDATVRGCRFIYTTEGLSNLTVTNLIQTGGIGGIEFVRLVGASPRAQNITVLNATIDDTFYPFSFQRSGDNVLIRGVTIHNPGRSYITYNVHDHDISMVIYERGVVQPTIGLGASADPADSAWQNSCTNMKLNIDFRSSTPTPATSANFILWIVQSTATSTPGYVKNLDLHFTHDQNTLSGSGTGYWFSKAAFGGALDTVGHGSRTDNVRVSGNFHLYNQQVNLIRFNCDGENGTGDSYTNIRFENLNIVAAQHASAVAAKLDGRGVTDMVWDVKCQGKVEFANFSDNVLQYRATSTYDTATTSPLTYDTITTTSSYSHFASGQCISTTQADFIIPVRNVAGDPQYLMLSPNTPGHFHVTQANGSPLACTALTRVASTGLPNNNTMTIRCTVASGLVAGNAASLLTGTVAGTKLRMGTGAVALLLRELVEQFPQWQMPVAGPASMGEFQRFDIVHLKNSSELPLTIRGFTPAGAILNLDGQVPPVPLSELTLLARLPLAEHPHLAARSWTD